MEPSVFPSTALLVLLANLTAGAFAAATVSLFTNDVNPGKAATLASFVLATFVGSTALPITAWGTESLDVNGDAESVGTLLSWNWTAAPAETVFGVVVKSTGAGTPLIAYARLSTPKSMAAVTDVLTVVPVLKLSALGFGSFVVIP
jgi:hypothetical protein